ncbi:hypothetical protein D3C75_893780 [compost metagenome]
MVSRGCGSPIWHPTRAVSRSMGSSLMPWGSIRSVTRPTFDTKAMSTKKPSTRHCKNGGSNIPAIPRPINRSCATTSLAPGATPLNDRWSGIGRRCCGEWGRRWTTSPMRSCSKWPRSAESVMMHYARCTSIINHRRRYWPRPSGRSRLNNRSAS